MSKQMRGVSNAQMSQMKRSLAGAVSEKDVESAWRTLFSQYFIKDITYDIDSPHNTDGYIQYQDFTNGQVGILLEFKDDLDFGKEYDRAVVVAQMIYYLKKFRDSGDAVPSILFAADKRQAFILYAPNFYHYLDEGYNFTLPPSSASKETQLMNDLLLDPNLNTWTYRFDGTTDEVNANIKEVFKEIEGIRHETGGSTNVHKVKISEQNIQHLFTRFSEYGLKDSGLDAVEQVGLFMQLLKGVNDPNVYLNPNNPNILMIHNKQYRVQGTFVTSFFKHYDRRLKPSEVDALTAIADNLIEDTKRRYHGDFWTPLHLVVRSQEYLEDVLGKDYRTNTLVWDPSAGTSNLTRDYQYSNLYVSTLHQAELDMGKTYNPGAKAKFQYDFLNDDVDKTPETHPNADDWVMPNNLFNALVEAGKTGQRVLFYTNPPYGTANSNSQTGGVAKKGMSNTLTSQYMKDNKWGASSQQLYAQFFARVYKLQEDFGLTNLVIGFFTPTIHFTGGSYFKGFNDRFFGLFEHLTGNLFSAGEFQGTSDNWGVTFSIYKHKIGVEQDTFELNIEDSEYCDEEMMVKMIHKGLKHYRRVATKDLIGTWVREPIKGVKQLMGSEYPILTSALKFKTTDTTKKRASLLADALGYMVYGGSSVGESASGVYQLTSVASRGNGVNILPSNFERVMVGLSARRVVSTNWVNAKDNYTKPNQTLPQDFILDCIIYALFDNLSFQAAYRNWEYAPGQTYSNTQLPGVWANQFFWVPLAQVLEWTDTPVTSLIYQDARGDSDRFVARYLQGKQLSDEAQALLDEGTELYRLSLQYRFLASHSIPGVHPTAWDSGYTQIKRILDEHHPNKGYNKEFLSKREDLRAKIEEGVYRYGMLVK